MCVLSKATFFKYLKITVGLIDRFSLQVVDKRTQSIRDFNDFLLRDSRIDYNLVSLSLKFV